MNCVCRLLTACLLAAVGYSGFAYDEAEAFGFRFGGPVPAKATDVKEFECVNNDLQAKALSIALNRVFK